jgi:hypothetical protein
MAGFSRHPNAVKRADHRWWIGAAVAFAVASGAATLAWRQRAPWLLVACGALGALCLALPAAVPAVRWNAGVRVEDVLILAFLGRPGTSAPSSAPARGMKIRVLRIRCLGQLSVSTRADTRSPNARSQPRDQSRVAGARRRRPPEGDHIWLIPMRSVLAAFCLRPSIPRRDLGSKRPSLASAISRLYGCPNE